MAPAQRGDLAGAHPREHAEAIVEPAIERDPFVRDQDLGFLACELRAESPLGILVDERPELASGEHARRRFQQAPLSTEIERSKVARMVSARHFPLSRAASTHALPR